MDEPEESGGHSNTMEALQQHHLKLPLPQHVEAKLTQELIEKVEVLLVTTKHMEWESVFRKMRSLGENTDILKIHPKKNTYMVGQFGKHCVALVQTDTGPLNAQSVVIEAVRLLKPNAAFMIGIGFGLRPHHQAIGDVMVSQRLATYDLQRVEGAKRVNLGEVARPGRYLSSLFMKSDTYNWQYDSSKIHRGLMLSGSKLIENSDYAKSLLEEYSDVIGGDMEGNGVYNACHDEGVEWIVVKGICRFVTSEAAEISNSEQLAAASATSLVLHVLSSDNLSGLRCVAERDDATTDDSDTSAPSPRVLVDNKRACFVLITAVLMTYALLFLGNESQEAWTPDSYPVFISYDPGFDFDKKQSDVVDGLLQRLERSGIPGYVSNPINSSKSFTTAIVQGSVFVALVDHYFYLQSEFCMQELKQALDSKDVKVLPILLSPASKYPSTGNEIRELFKERWDSEWQPEWKSDKYYLRVVHQVYSLALNAKRRVYEDASFGFGSVVDDVRRLLSENGVDKLPQQADEAAGPSIWRLLNPIRECAPFGVDKAIVDIHQGDFERIVDILTNSEETSSVSIAGLKAAGGVGKTYLARRIASCPTVQEYFASEGVLWAEFGEHDSTAQPALESIYRDLGGEDGLSFGEDANGRLTQATLLFNASLHQRQPTALLVLDDIWDRKYLQVFQEIVKHNAGVKVLVTTRFKNIVTDVFGQENDYMLIDLNPSLRESDAIKLMNLYAGINKPETKGIKNEVMTKIAKRFGYHAKALAIVCGRYKRFQSWERLLESVEKSNLPLSGKSTALDYVSVAVEQTLAHISEELDVDLEEYFLKLGVLLEGSRFSLEDLNILWGSESFDTEEIAKALIDCSVLEKDTKNPDFYERGSILMNTLGAHFGYKYKWEEKWYRVYENVELLLEYSYSPQTQYYLHDLVRESARKNNSTQERERQFIQKMHEIIQNKKHRVTDYIFRRLRDYLPQHHTLNPLWYYSKRFLRSHLRHQPNLSLCGEPTHVGLEEFSYVQVAMTTPSPLDNCVKFSSLVLGICLYQLYN